MKDRLAAPGVGSVVALLAILAMGVGGAVAAPATKPSVRIGVYDSRGVAIAYARSAGFRESMTRLRGDFEQAKARGDSAQMKTLEQQGQWMQVRLHQRGFSTAGAGDLLARVADGLAGVAREAGVVLIVSKWEMPFKDPAVEIVDVTLPIARLFQPDEQTLQVLGGIAKQPPVPFDELSLDPND